MIYLKAYVKTRFNRPKVEKDLIIPSNEMMLKELVFTYTFWLRLLIKFEKLTSQPFNEQPRSEMALVISSLIRIICSQIHRDEFIIAIKTSALKINCLGDSELEYIKCESR
jgi:hypothetical protein